MKRFDDQSEMNKRHEHHVELLESREDTAKALESAKQPLDFVAPLVHLTIVLPGLDPVGLRRHNRDESQVQSQLTGFVPLISTIHQQVNRPLRRAQFVQQLASFSRIVRLPRRQRERYCRSSIRSTHMNLGCPAAARFPDSLRAVFFNAPVPSG